MNAYNDRSDVEHFIGGQRTAGHGQRSQPVFNPATGDIARTLRLGDTRDVDAAVASAKQAFAGLAQHAADPPRARHAALPGTDEPAPRRPGRDHHGRARQGVLRRAGRGRARHRRDRVRLRHPATAQGRLHRAGLHRHRQLDHAPAAGRGGRHHAVQLPLRWCRAGCSRWRSPPATPSSSSPASATRRPRCSWPTCSRKPACRTASSTWCRATRTWSTRCSRIATSRPSASSARPRSRTTSTRPAPSTASACRPWAARRTTWW